MSDADDIAKVKADAVMFFVNEVMAAFEAGFINDHKSSLFDLYHCARGHVERNYAIKAPTIESVWGEHVANAALHGWNNVQGVKYDS
ncbi:hypothetical protein [Shewanella halifaxensis]|uniref:hypothetical protein n=1 Tax=Shewanella halifaxensis TaxID=271098 RepID=UPI000D58DC4C|nr:hypothetical protein [Shewanella halifaxensis]